MTTETPWSLSGQSLRDGSSDRSRVVDGWPQKYELFGVGISATTYQESIAAIMNAARRRQGAVVSLHAAHAVVSAACDFDLNRKVNEFQIVAPDGQPVRWALNRLHRTGLRDRVYGPELMLRLCRRAAQEGVSVYLYGGAPEVVEKLRANLLQRFPDLVVAGAESPPFHPLSPQQDEAAVRRINESGSGIVFIGLGCPKQDHFAYDHRNKINAVQVCVGAAFDFHAGHKRMAPDWMQRVGLEWLFRLCQEPRRLGRRYLVTNTLFIQKFAAQWLRQKLAALWRWHVRLGQAAESANPDSSRLCCACESSVLLDVDSLGQHLEGRAAAPMCQEKVGVAVVVPCYNEALNVAYLLERISELTETLGDDYRLHFVLVDDGSTDETWPTLCKELGDRDGFTLVQHERNRGVAAAIMTGIRRSNAAVVCSMDADCTYDPSQLAQMLPLLVDGVDVVTASPYHPLGSVRNVSPGRLALSKFASFLYRRTMRQKLFTYTSCFRVYRRSAVAELELDNDGFVGIAELLWKLDRQGSRIVECPAQLDARRFGQSKMRVTAEIGEHLKLMGRVWRDRLSLRSDQRSGGGGKIDIDRADGPLAPAPTPPVDACAGCQRSRT